MSILIGFAALSSLPHAIQFSLVMLMIRCYLHAVHAIVHLARIATVAGASHADPDAITLLEKATDRKFDPVIEGYWKAWIGRKSFTDVRVF